MNNLTAFIQERKLLFACALIVLVNIFVYYPALDIPFFRGDIFILLMPYAESPDNYFSIFEYDPPQLIRPLGPLPYYLYYSWWGLNSYPNLFTTFLVHIVVCVECFLLVNIFCRNFGTSLLSSLLFSVFYLNTVAAAIDYATGYSIPLAISLLAVMLFLSKPEPVGRSIFISALFLVAMAFKESTIVFPVIAVLLAKSLHQYLKPRHFIPILVPSFIYGCYALFLIFFVFPTDAESQRYLHKGSFFDTLWWNLVYGLVPFNFGNVNYLTAALSHLYLIGLAILYLLLDNPNAKEKIYVLFPCAFICYLPFAIGGQGLGIGGYSYNAYIFIAPMLIILFNEYLLRLRFLWRPPIFNPTVCLILILLISNFFSVRMIIANYKLSAEITLRDLKAEIPDKVFPQQTSAFNWEAYRQYIEDGTIERPVPRIDIVPHFMSPLVWGDYAELFPQALRVWRLSERRRRQTTKPLRE